MSAAPNYVYNSRRPATIRLFLLLPLLVLLVFGCNRTSTDPALLNTLPEIVDYNFHIKPILSDRCFTCHGPDENTREAELRLDTPEGMFAALASSGKAIVPGKVHKSELTKLIQHEDPEEVMPPHGLEPLSVICRGRQVIPIDETPLLSACQARVVAHRRAIASAQGLIADKLKECIESDPITDKYFRISIEVYNAYPYAVFNLISRSAPTLSDETVSVEFRTWLEKWPVDKYYIHFHVNSDGDDSCAMAQRLAKEHGFQVHNSPAPRGYQHRVRLDKGFLFQGKPQTLICVGQAH